MTTTQWFPATVAPVREGYYDVRLQLSDDPQDEATIEPMEWCDGAWWATSDGEWMGMLTPDFTWREMSEPSPNVLPALDGIRSKASNRGRFKC